MAKINRINQFTSEFTVDADPANPDSYTQFDINGTGEFRVGHDETDTSFRISQGSALGTNDTFKVNADGEVNFPLQPCFLGQINTENNVTGDNTIHDIGSVTATTEIFDQGSNYFPGDGAGTRASFTAPVDGVYILNYVINFFNDPTGGTTFILRVQGTNLGNYETYFPARNLLTGFYGDITGRTSFTMSCVAGMDASDQARFSFQLFAPGSKTDDVISQWVSGVLVC